MVRVFSTHYVTVLEGRRPIFQYGNYIRVDIAGYNDAEFTIKFVLLQTSNHLHARVVLQINFRGRVRIPLHTGIYKSFFIGEGHCDLVL